MTIYDAGFYDTIREGTRASAAVVVPLVLGELDGSVQTVIDVGCGEGWWAQTFADHGCEAIGIDGHYVTGSPLGERFIPHDLGQPLPEHLAGRFDLAVSLEVAEHLPASRAESFISDLTQLAPTVLFSAAIPGQGGTGHCFPADTVVSGPAPRRSFARHYQGPLVEMRFASGQFLAATPNHPILTAQGWVATGLLREGDYVVRCTDSEGITIGVPGEYQVPTSIHDVATSLGVSARMPPGCVPVSSEDFHGDGIGSEIAIVRTDGKLENHGKATLLQPGCKQALVFAGVSDASLPGDGTTMEGFIAPCAPFDTGDQSVRNVFAPFRSAARRGDAIHLTASPWGDSGGGQAVSYPVPGYAELIGEGRRGDPRFVKTDQIVDIRTRIVDQEVYNLSTEPGWYLANGVIVHNCNEQWPGYWVELFENQGYSVSGALRWHIWDDTRVDNWYRQNLMLASNSPGDYPWLFDVPTTPMWPVVHPVLYDARRAH